MHIPATVTNWKTLALTLLLLKVTVMMVVVTILRISSTSLPVSLVQSAQVYDDDYYRHPQSHPKKQIQTKSDPQRKNKKDKKDDRKRTTTDSPL